MDLNAVLKKLVYHKASDLHLKVGMAPIIRLSNGDLCFVKELRPMTREQIEVIARKIISEEKYKIFLENKEVDVSYKVEGVGRFRVNIYRDIAGPSIAFRIIPERIPTFPELRLPNVLAELVLKPRGLVLITGPTGSGKSTTLASMIEVVNKKKRCHVITIEDPIEFVHKSGKSIVTQREVSVHTQSFASAIRSTLRQDPDVIMVGEMRDLETIAAAITLAETGHLVLSTLHTTDSAQTVDRMIDVFPAYQQQQIRAQLSGALLAAISQTLVPKADGKDRVAAFEVMIVNDAIRSCIKDANTHQIYSMIQIGKKQGMQTLDDSLADLVKEGLITETAAFAKAHDPELLRIALTTT